MTHPEPAFNISLAQLFAGFARQDAPAEIIVKNIKLDSRQVNPGDLFIAVRGTVADGTQFIDSAVERGAVAIALDEDCVGAVSECPVPLIGVTDIKSRLGDIADRFFDYPSRHLSVIGVTGTNGKTSCCQYIAQALGQLNIPAGVIGTLGWGDITALQHTGNTTPDVVSLHRMLASFVARQYRVVAMEVSSHGLDQSRTDGVRFDTAVFTNLTRDHLDYHPSMAHYGASKSKLFFRPGLKHAVINGDDDFGHGLRQTLDGRLPVYGYGLNQETDVGVSNIELSASGMRACLHSPWGDGILTSSLLGRFNLSNLLAVFSVLCLQGASVDQALAAIAQLDTAQGRMQRYGGDGLPAVIVDYAHTPDALSVVLTTLRELTVGQLICVFGCGGDRDSGKRALMGQVAEQFSDVVVITNDNPRNESPSAIIEDIQGGMKHPERAIVCQDRGQAIRKIINKARASDLVLIAGKGHETYQQTGAVRIAFNDAEQVKQALNIKVLMGTRR